eukprot:8506656-Alexandrium_andersonii.AAC.1
MAEAHAQEEPRLRGDARIPEIGDVSGQAQLTAQGPEVARHTPYAGPREDVIQSSGLRPQGLLVGPEELEVELERREREDL